MAGTAKEKPPSHWAIKEARQAGYDQGFADGMSQAPDFSKAYRLGYSDGRQARSKKPRPKLMKALMSSAYRTRYFAAYRAGFADGTRKARQVELKAISLHDQQPAKDREDRSR